MGRLLFNEIEPTESDWPHELGADAVYEVADGDEFIGYVWRQLDVWYADHRPLRSHLATVRGSSRDEVAEALRRGLRGE